MKNKPFHRQNSHKSFSISLVKSMRLWLLGFVFLFIGCSQSSQSCSCAEPIPGGFPKSKVVRNIGQVKFTRQGFDFFQNNSNLIVKQFLPNGLTFNVPPSNSGGTQVCLNPPCTVTGKIKKLGIDLIPKETLRTNLILDLSSSKIKIRYKKGFIKITCYLTVTMKNKHIRTDIRVKIDPATQYMTFDVGNPSFSIKSGDFKLSGGFSCKLANAVKGLFNKLIEKEVKKAVNDAVKDLSCQKCQKSSDCVSGATCSKGKCMRGNACVPAPIGMEGQMDLSKAASGLGGKSMTKFMFSYFIGSTAEVKTSGLELGSLGGTHAERSRCVPKKNFKPLPTPPVFSFPGAAPDGKTYMLGAAFSQVFFDSAARSLYLSGLLCLNIDKNLSPQIGGMLSAQGLGALVTPSILSLTKKAPMYIAMRPSEVPDISIGKGTFTKDKKGKTIIKEPLIDLKIPALGFDFYLLLYDRWIRLFTYKVDLALPMGLTVKPNNKIGLIMGDMATTLTNPRVENSHILKEDPKQMANGLHNLFKSILPLAMGKLGNQEFSIPDMKGFKISVRGITGQVPRSDRPNRFKFLTFFADLGIGQPGKPLLPFEILDLHYVKTTFPPHFYEKLRGRVLLKRFPSVTFDILNADPRREYSVRLNSAMWGPYSSETHRILESPQFIMQGRHTIYVRSRLKGNYAVADDAAGWFHVVIDYTPPQLFVQSHAKGLIITAKDNLSEGHTLDIQYRIDGGSWVSISSGSTISGLPNKATVEVRAQDEAGNIQTRIIRWEKQVALPLPSSIQPQNPAVQEQTTALGCQMTHRTPPLTFFFLLLLFSIFFFPHLLQRKR